MEDYGLSRYDATVLVSDLETPLYYEKVLKNLKGWKDQIEAAKLASNWISGELFAALNEKNLSIDKSPIAPEKLAQLLNLIGEGKLSGRLAKDVFEIMIETGQEPEKIVEEKGLVQISDTGALEAIVDQVIKDNPKMVEEYKSGKDKLFGFFVGQTMKLSGGKANPQMINEILKKKL
jgi:aspartyl-tRNA(Asn)/glutamyl-tRNA(Gln) amidotransferase subunit B